MEAVKNPNDTLNPKFTSSKISKILPVKVKKPSGELYLVVLAVKHPEGKKVFSVAGTRGKIQNSSIGRHTAVAIGLLVTATDWIV